MPNQGHVNTLAAVGGFYNLETQRFQLAPENETILLDIVDNQQAWPALIGSQSFNRPHGFRLWYVIGIGLTGVEVKGERRAHARVRLYCDRRAQRLREVLTDSKAQAGAVRLLSGFSRLNKGVEQIGDVVGVDADAGVFDCEADRRSTRQVQIDPASVGELEGIGKEIDEDLAKFAMIGVQKLRNLGGDGAAENEAGLIGSNLK